MQDFPIKFVPVSGVLILGKEEGHTHPDNVLDLFLVRLSIFLEEVVCLCLSRRLWIRVVEEILDSQQDLLDGDSWLPRLFFVQDAKTDSARRVDIRVEKRRNELAYRGDVSSRISRGGGMRCADT